MTNLQKNLKKIRENRGLTQQEMADKLGISVQAYSRYENTNQDPKSSRLLEMANILDVDVESLLNQIKDYDLIENQNYICIKHIANLNGYVLNFHPEYIEFGKDGLIFKCYYSILDDIDDEIRTILINKILNIRQYKLDEDKNANI